MNKQELRRTIRQRKHLYTADELAALSQPLIAGLLQHPRVRAAHTIALYMSLPDEVQTRSLIDALYNKGTRVVLPAVTGPGEMEFRLYEGPASLREGDFHIMEPTGHAFTDLDAIEIIVVPGMAFDRDGNRLGRGKGYYDRMLPRLRHAYKLGLCFPFQKVDHVPTEATDIQMDEVL